MGIGIAVAQALAVAFLKTDQLSGLEDVERRGGHINLVADIQT